MTHLGKASSIAPPLKVSVIAALAIAVAGTGCLGPSPAERPEVELEQPPGESHVFAKVRRVGDKVWIEGVEGKGTPKPRLGLRGMAVVGIVSLALMVVATSLTLSSRAAEAAPPVEPAAAGTTEEPERARRQEPSPPIIPGMYGLSFDGEGDFVEVPDRESLDIGDQFTVEVWMRFDGGVGERALLSKEVPWRSGYALIITGLKESRYCNLTFGVGDGERFRNLTVPGIIKRGWWHHVAVSWYQGQTSLFVDGRVVGRSVFPSAAPARVPLRIGKGSAELGRHFNGEIAEIRFWTTARVEEEIRRNMTRNLHAYFGGLGITAALEDDQLTVISPLKDSPAARAGILPGDRIVRIEGESTDNMPLSDAVYMLRGELGTEVTVTVRHEEEDEEEDVTIRREIIRIHSVRPGPEAAGLLACWTFEEGSGDVARDICPDHIEARLGSSPDADDADPKWVPRWPIDVDVEEVLQRKVTFSFAEVPLEQVLHFLSLLTEINFVVHPQVQEQRPTVTLRLDDVRAIDALPFIAQDAGCAVRLEGAVVVFLPKELEAEAEEAAPTDPGLREALKQKVTFAFVETPLEQVANFLRTVARINIVLHPEVREQKPLVTLSVNDVELADALQLVAQDAGCAVKFEGPAVVFIPKVPQGGPEQAVEVTDPAASGYQEALKKKVSVNIERSPDGNRLTVQYAVIAVCKAAGIPYQWDKSRRLTDRRCARYIGPVRLRNVEAQKAIADIVSPVGLTFSVDEKGVYLHTALREVVLKHDDGSMEGKRSLGASGHFVQFECPPGKWYLTEVHIFGSRYGTAQPPRGEWTITLCDSEFKTVHFIKRAYAIFQKGKERWYKIPVPPVELPLSDVTVGGLRLVFPFWINVVPNPSQTKGVYVGYDSSDQECFSKTGRIPEELSDLETKYDWMIRAYIRPEGG